MPISPTEKISTLRDYLERIDSWTEEFGEQIQLIVNRHKREGGNLEYVYVQHFHAEIRSLSALFQYLLRDDANRKYVFFPVRGSIEILLYLEHVLKLAATDKNEVLNLLSRDMAQSAAAINAAAPAPEDHRINTTLQKIDIVNKILKTNFSLEKSKPRSRVFPRISDLCDSSTLALKDSRGSDIYHIYALYSESNHLRLSSQASISTNVEINICWALEYFIEIYIKFYEQLINTKIFPEEFATNLTEIKQPLGL